MESWKGLDVEEQDLESFLKKCNSSTTLITGPVGNVQAAIINRGTKDAQSTQEFAQAIAVATYERDFKSNAWLWVEKFIKFHGLVKDGDINNTTHLGSCNRTGILPFVACIVEQCNSNGLGDMQICVKDPTSTVWASVHRKVLLHPEYRRDFNVGAVLLLNIVATFSHKHKICYLNITVRNIVKIFKANICELTNELVQATMKSVIEPHPSLDPKV
ncbi:hypothetical protein DEO72_LG7g1552 [Vigna unguiculata]|uniref:Homologous recombination OB-fold protein OB-fold domain-containing protein n=1 Tax=Vigna unguiculata TaxID=3917 RepID=A0A4D6MHM0_VIGUN|nr:hypothetical protein DEO72_LG7g1552 [Vigna unguiculata]